MPETLLPPLPLPPGRPGAHLHAKSLAPKYEEEHHQLYVDLLTRAINAEGTRNIALTGAYGTGKSSVLEAIRASFGKKVVALSLSTIDPEVHDRGDNQDNQLSRTNQIQKELVKQLLYQLPPSSVPRSSFRRASVPNVRKEWSIALIAGVSLAALMLLLGLAQPVVELWFPLSWRQWIVYTLMFPLTVAVAWVLVLVARGRPTVSASVQAGTATVTLSKQAATYFDEYLDEIVYFFQASRRWIVLVEDIDRFEDAQVFDTLRALNLLLNESSQIDRRIVFVYAIRDSVFESIGRPGTENVDPGAYSVDTLGAPQTDPFKRVSRTKFFDFIVPVVPFVSVDNARDLMTAVMDSRDFNIDPALIRLAARHAPDMRMIHNIRNEFEVYRSQLVTTNSAIPGITDDLVFAMILYKNSHLADFERIRHRESALDDLYVFWRALIASNVARTSRALAEHRRTRLATATRNARAESLGRKLTALIQTLQTAADAGGRNTTVALASPATADTVHIPDTWEAIVSEDSQRLTITNRYNGGTATLEFSASQLATLLNVRLDREGWEASELDSVDSLIAEGQSELEHLRHHTWSDLQDSALSVPVDELNIDLRAQFSDLESVTFDQAVDALLPSELAKDLVRAGFLTTHFALYTSRYYGNHLSPDAMEYIRRSIEPGIPDASFPLRPSDVEQILTEQDAMDDGADLFSDVSILNVSFFDYLLTQRPAAARMAARMLASAAPEHRIFLDMYMSDGNYPAALMAAITPSWSGALVYAAVAQAGTASRAELLNAAFASMSISREYEISSELATLIETHYQSMNALCEPGDRDKAQAALRAVKKSGAMFGSVEPFNDLAREIVVSLRLFPLTRSNLSILRGKRPFALDALRDDEELYRYALSSIESLVALAEDPKRRFPVLADPVTLPDVINDLAAVASPREVQRFIEALDSRVQISDLSAVPKPTWPQLASEARVEATFENVRIYIDEYGPDENLAQLLRKRRTITQVDEGDPAERRSVALKIVRASDVLASTTLRVRLAKRLMPDKILAAELSAESGDLLARLLRAKLVEDDAAIFSASLMVDPGTWTATIKASKRFGELVSPALLPPDALPAIVRDETIAYSVRLAIVSSLPQYLDGAPRLQVVAIASALVDTRWRLPLPILDALRATGAWNQQLVALIMHSEEKLDLEDLRALFRGMGGEYARVAAGGRGAPSFRDDAIHERVLRRFLESTVRRIEHKTFKGTGRRLVCVLQ